MELKNEKEIIDTTIQQFQESTFFIANWMKCNFITRLKLSSLIDDKGEISGRGVMVFIDESIPDGEFQIGMGQCPSITKGKF